MIMSNDGEKLTLCALLQCVYLYLKVNTPDIIIDNNISAKVSGAVYHEKLYNSSKFSCFDSLWNQHRGFNLSFPEFENSNYILSIYSNMNKSIHNGVTLKRLNVFSNNCMWTQYFMYPENKEFSISIPIRRKGIYKVIYHH